MQICDVCQRTDEHDDILIICSPDGQTLCMECAGIGREINKVLDFFDNNDPIPLLDAEDVD